MQFITLYLLGISAFVYALSGSCLIEPLDRLDCGYLGIEQNECLNRGCCWSPVGTIKNTPWCFHKVQLCDGYYASNVVETSNSVTADLNIINKHCNKYGKNVEKLKLQISLETNSRLRVKITDHERKRWEVPTNVIPETSTFAENQADYPLFTKNHNYKMKSFAKRTWGKMEIKKESEKYLVTIQTHPFNFAVVRKDTLETIFNTSSSATDVMVFEDQYLELSTEVPKDANLYGLGEGVRNFRLNNEQSRITIFSRDAPLPENENVYGAHPFYMEMRHGKSHGVFLKNSNGMDIVLKTGSITYKVIGGVFDFYFFIGSSPADTIKQYYEVIGKPSLVPYWSLGFHQCRYGYRTLSEVIDVVNNFEINHIPLETVWIDIDYMDGYRDFTFDPVKFPLHEVQKFVSKLKSKGQKFILIVDPGIKIDPGLKSYDEGIAADIFIKNHDSTNFIGEVWPGLVHFPDFMHPGAQKYWTVCFDDFYKMVKLDGVWIDMNELANFCSGDCHKGVPKRKTNGFDPNYPPYKINNAGIQAPLFTRTTPMDALHYGNVLEYNVHNLYGILEAQATYNTLLELNPNERPFIVSRSSFPGAGKYTAHWTGDNWSTWEHLRHSIIGILNFQLFGIPMVGADICGFGGDATEELCARWMALGSFYPFSRNHNSIHSKSQEPYRWPIVLDVSKEYLRIRYNLLPYWYTLMYQATTFGDTVVRPLFFEFPNDEKTYGMDTQFLVGSAILVSPVLQEGATKVKSYFPAGVWYDYFSGARVNSTSQKGQFKLLNAPIDALPLHVRGGSIIPTQTASLTVGQSRKNNFHLTVALDQIGHASGYLYLDDGESQNVFNEFSYITFEASFHSPIGYIRSHGTFNYHHSEGRLDLIQVYGVDFQPETVTVNGKIFRDKFMYMPEKAVLLLLNLDLPMDEPLKIFLEKGV